MLTGLQWSVVQLHVSLCRPVFICHSAEVCFVVRFQPYTLLASVSQLTLASHCASSVVIVESLVKQNFCTGSVFFLVSGAL